MLAIVNLSHGVGVLCRASHPSLVRRGVLFLGIAIIGLVIATAPRALACEVDDELDAAAAGVLHEDELGATSLASKSMSCKLLVPGPHLRITAPRTPSSADTARAKELRASIRQSLGKYEDYRVAIQDGYEIRFPNVQQKLYHFSNSANARSSYLEAFDPMRPTSLLYEKKGTSYELVGVMYMAPQHASEASLDRRFPLSVAPWHLHTNICLPPRMSLRGIHKARGLFGPTGSIATEAACTAVGGAFRPAMYGWMTHVDFYDSDEKN